MEDTSSELYSYIYSGWRRSAPFCGRLRNRRIVAFGMMYETICPAVHDGDMTVIRQAAIYIYPCWRFPHRNRAVWSYAPDNPEHLRARMRAGTYGARARARSHKRARPSMPLACAGFSRRGYWPVLIFLASGIWPVLILLSVSPFSVLIMASAGFLIFCGFPEYWFSYRWFFL